jgi:hypothetical protein
VPSSDGRLLVRRPRDADHETTRYVIINRRGELDGELSMSANLAIVGFGRDHVYVTSTDRDGIQTLQRHPWPD